MTTERPYSCVCPEPEAEKVRFVTQCRLCKRPIMSPDDRFTLTQVARMFRTSHSKIIRRALDGDFPYNVDANGHMIFTRKDLLPHLEELARKNDRLV